MGKSSRFRILLNRRKYANWENGAKLKIVGISLAILAIILTTTFVVNNINFNSTEIIPVVDGSINEEIYEKLNAEVNIYDNEEYIYEEKLPNSIVADNKESAIVVEIEQDSLTHIEEKIEDEKVFIDDAKKKNEVTFTVLGEIMMGAEVTENLNYAYSMAFKSISQYTRNSDFTYGILSTNITNVEKISNVKSRYLVTRDIRTAFNTLGIDCLNIATDHITDYNKTIFVTTVETLKNNNIFMAGINDSTLYVDICGKKVAIIAAVSSYVGNKTTYQEFGINMYNKEKMRADIQEAKDKADVIIVDVSWGRDYMFGVTSLMRQIAYDAIDSGANLVLGSNALGIYPIYEYKDVPIIYSTGYLITDSNYHLAQMSYIWKFNINSENKIDKLFMIPVGTENKTYTKDLRISNPELCAEFNELTNRWNNENGLNSTVNSDGTITVLF